MTSEYILTLEQFAYMEKHKETIFRKRAESEILGWGNDYLEQLWKTDEFKRVFRDLCCREVTENGVTKRVFIHCIDNILDRWEDTPGYDNTLLMEIYNTLTRLVEAGELKRYNPPRQPRKKRVVREDIPCDSEVERGIVEVELRKEIERTTH
ncbi:MAG: hypothetical protein AAFV33_11900 [Chloroflexota bacterium]